VDTLSTAPSTQERPAGPPVERDGRGAFDDLVPRADLPGRGQAQPTVIIEPVQPGLRFRTRELWRYRKLLRFFAREFYERLFRRTILGRTWIFLRPLGGTAVGALVYGGLLGAPSQGLPYFLFFMVGMAGWELFERSLLWVTRSLYMMRKLLKKLYFPRLILPIAGVTPGVVWAGVFFLMVFVAIGAYVWIDGELYLNTGPELLVALAGALLAVALAIGIGLFTSILGANTRDMFFTLRYITQLWFFLTPVIYPLEALPESLQGVALANPMTPIVEMIKWGLIGAGSVHLEAFAIAIAEVLLIWTAGLWFFNRAGATSVDSL
jgi:lipopolysaccharide transport system permease protein